MAACTSGDIATCSESDTDSAMATKVLRSSVRKVQPGMEIPVDPEGAGQSGLPSFEVTAVGESDAGRSANSDEKEDTPRGPKAACAACRTISEPGKCSRVNGERPQLNERLLFRRGAMYPPRR